MICLIHLDRLPAFQQGLDSVVLGLSVALFTTSDQLAFGYINDDQTRVSQVSRISFEGHL